MRKIIFIFVLLSCQKEMSNISDAIPIQFWPIGDETFNEKVNGYVDHRCYHQEFSCVDPIKLQVTDTNLEILDGYDLSVRDQDGVEIANEPFIKTYTPYGADLKLPNENLVTNPIGVNMTNFSGSNRSNSVPFAHNAIAPESLDCVAVAETDKQNSRYLAINRIDANAALGWPPGDYVIRIRAKNNSTLSSDALGLTAFGMPNGTSQTSLSSTSIPSTLVNDNTFRNVDISFTTTQWWPYLAIAATRLGGGGSFEIACYFYSIQIFNSVKDKKSINSLLFTSNELSFCDQYVRLYIQKNGTDAFKSDLLKFNTSIAINQGHGSVLMSYKSTVNYAGIVYPNDGNYFNLRIPARFFEQRNNTSQSSIQLSNSKVINTSVILKMQWLLETTMLPDYMHNKIQLALAHAVKGSLLIDGFEWTIDEGYERVTPDKKNPFRFGKVWLTKKNNLVRNII